MERKITATRIRAFDLLLTPVGAVYTPESPGFLTQ